MMVTYKVIDYLGNEYTRTIPFLDSGPSAFSAAAQLITTDLSEDVVGFVGIKSMVEIPANEDVEEIQ